MLLSKYVVVGLKNGGGDLVYTPHMSSLDEYRWLLYWMKSNKTVSALLDGDQGKSHYLCDLPLTG